MSTSRIQRRFENLASREQKGFVAYITAGDPSADGTLEVMRGLEAAGTDIIELGVPFSDPLADGPTIQAASGRALAAGMTLPGVLELVRRFREESELPIVLFSYLNPIYTMGFGKFRETAARVGVDGLLILDLPPEEVQGQTEFSDDLNLDPIRLIAPTTTPDRMSKVAAGGRGFLYYVSREGVTGEQTELSESIGSQVAELRKHSNLPIAVGFGISTPEQSALVARDADAVVVGSAIVRQIAEHGTAPHLGDRVTEFVRPLVLAAKNG